MSLLLSGPFDFDEQNATASARNALAAVSAALKTNRTGFLKRQNSPGTDPGVYIIVDPDEDGGGIVGFWLVFGPSYLETGPAGPPDRVPPLVNALLDAATEEVWWKNLPVSGISGGTWEPRIVLEWPGFLASRSTLPPPGVPTRTIGDDQLTSGDEESWMDPVGFMEEEVGGFYGDDLGFFSPDEPTQGASETPKAEPKELVDPWEGLPLQRSMVCLVTGSLTYDSKAHTGSFEVIRWAAWQDGDTKEPKPLHDWLFVAGLEEGPDAHGLGGPLELPGGRVAFPITGWLTRELSPWPQQPTDIITGALTERDVSNPIKQKVALSIGLTIGNLGLCFALAIGVAALAKPKQQVSPKQPDPDPQPALSMCSADHAAFVNEFRCQVRRIAADLPSDHVDYDDCGDIGGTAGPSDDDLQAAYCGILDRAQDGRQGNYHWLPPNDADRQYNYGELAAAQACFNVLGQPETYEQGFDYSVVLESSVADPDSFLRNKALGIEPLKELLGELDGACETYRGRIEYSLEGAMVATHVGSVLAEDPARDSDAAALRRSVMQASTADMPGEYARCFADGAENGISGGQFSDLCGEVDLRDRYYSEQVKIWAALSGSTTEDRDLVTRYVHSRFGQEVPDGSLELWQCHRDLTTGEADFSTSRARWSQVAPVFAGTGYMQDDRRTVRSQLQLDAILRSMDEDGENFGSCWTVIEARSAAYEPVHPLLADLEDGNWISNEQQLCAQVCATFYQVENSYNSDAWVTANSDLGKCIVRNAPNWDDPPRAGGGLDRLWVPWNNTRARWLEDSEDTPKVQSCSGTRGDAWMELTGNDANGRPYGDDAVWMCPSAAEVCSFNLIAQNYMPPGESGFLVAGKSPRSWAGETATSSQIAGGPPGKGLAATAADNLSSYGRSRSKATCGHAATQCFTGLMLETMGQQNSQRYEWREGWSSRISELSATPVRDVSQDYGPWCALVRPYLYTDGNLPEGQIDYTCAMGVDEALRTVEATLAAYERDASAEDVQ